MFLFIAFLFVCSFWVSRQIRLNDAGQHLEDTFGREGTKYKRMSIFFCPQAEMDEEYIRQIRNEFAWRIRSSPSLDTEKMETVFIDAYEAADKIDVSYRHTFLKVDASFVGGAYFRFHSMPFAAGHPFDEEKTKQDGAIVSESLAFALFGSGDCVGKTIWMRETPIRICGVVEDRKGYNSRAANSERKRIYLPYRLKGQQEEEKQGMIAYEILLPEILDGFAQKMVEEVFAINPYDREASLKEKEIYLVDETDRFRVLTLFHTAVKWKQRLMRTVPVAFPDWQNERILTENQLILIYLFRIFLTGYLFLECVRIYLRERQKRKAKMKGNMLL